MKFIDFETLDGYFALDVEEIFLIAGEENDKTKIKTVKIISKSGITAYITGITYEEMKAILVNTIKK